MKLHSQDNDPGSQVESSDAGPLCPTASIPDKSRY